MMVCKLLMRGPGSAGPSVFGQWKILNPGEAKGEAPNRLNTGSSGVSLRFAVPSRGKPQDGAPSANARFYPGQELVWFQKETTFVDNQGVNREIYYSKQRRLSWPRRLKPILLKRDTPLIRKSPSRDTIRVFCASAFKRIWTPQKS
ncbi:hypothetical protein DMR_32140 [Solidesulfovibrio magneticus RS-1]|uniref:Uncharacterized protein n=1 Tax=Solidesulfovibrio magneticus (strain ATCC 700980 / DSM 13731 / RS-1) TaxID=573370 RepID=C4XJF5_SOLM1|nr:hypothetical protein DMR_32140 [Solidesulfovibrio magneticus RS-1]